MEKQSSNALESVIQAPLYTFTEHIASPNIATRVLAVNSMFMWALLHRSICADSMYKALLATALSIIVGPTASVLALIGLLPQDTSSVSTRLPADIELVCVAFIAVVCLLSSQRYTYAVWAVMALPCVHTFAYHVQEKLKIKSYFSYAEVSTMQLTFVSFLIVACILCEPRQFNSSSSDSSHCIYDNNTGEFQTQSCYIHARNSEPDLPAVFEIVVALVHNAVYGFMVLTGADIIRLATSSSDSSLMSTFKPIYNAWVNQPADAIIITILPALGFAICSTKHRKNEHDNVSSEQPQPSDQQQNNGGPKPLVHPKSSKRVHIAGHDSQTNKNHKRD